MGLRVSGSLILTCGMLGVGACSKNEVQVGGQSSGPQPVLADAAKRQQAIDRLIEIDRLLALPPTGRPEQSDQRTALRAEREALIASGQVPYSGAPRSVSRAANVIPPNAQRTVNGNVVNYTVPTAPSAPITVAGNSQEKNLSQLEQMTPTERERYYKAIKVHNTQRVEIDVQHSIGNR